MASCVAIINDFGANDYLDAQVPRVSNPFFFPENVASVEYEGWFILVSGENPIKQSTTLYITLLEVFDFGTLYALQISEIDNSLIDWSDIDWPIPFTIQGDFRYLGYFLVTESTIYHKFVTELGFLDDDTDSLIESLLEDKTQTLSDFHIVMYENDTSKEIRDGWVMYVEVFDNFIIFSQYYHDPSPTRFYRRIVWERGVGITHYVSGMGMMRNHIEFGLDPLEVYSNRRWVGGRWIIGGE